MKKTGISPVIGVTILIAITVILAVSTGLFFLGIGDSATSTEPANAAVSIDSHGDGVYTIQLVKDKSDGELSS